MTYTYFISYAYSFDCEEGEDGIINHRWFYGNLWETLSERFDTNEKIVFLYRTLKDLHKCKYLMLLNVQLVNKKLFGKAPKLEDCKIVLKSQRELI